MARNIDALAWEIEEYLPSMSAMESLHTKKEMEAEYTRLRRIANKRLEGIRGTDYEQTNIFQMHKHGFPSVKQLSDSDLAPALADIAKFISAKTSTLRGMKEQERKTLQSLHKHGYTDINHGNLKDFGTFMDTVRAMMTAAMFDSTRAYDVFTFGMERGISREKLLSGWRYMQEHPDTMPHATIHFNSKANSDAIRAELEEAFKEM